MPGGGWWCEGWVGWRVCVCGGGGWDDGLRGRRRVLQRRSEMCLSAQLRGAVGEHIAARAPPRPRRQKARAAAPARRARPRLSRSQRPRRRPRPRPRGGPSLLTEWHAQERGDQGGQQYHRQYGCHDRVQRPKHQRAAPGHQEQQQQRRGRAAGVRHFWGRRREVREPPLGRRRARERRKRGEVGRARGRRRAGRVPVWSQHVHRARRRRERAPRGPPRVEAARRGSRPPAAAAAAAAAPCRASCACRCRRRLRVDAAQRRAGAAARCCCDGAATAPLSRGTLRVRQATAQVAQQGWTNEQGWLR